MKTIVKVEKEIDVDAVRIVLPIRYGDEDISYNFPLRDGDTWTATISVDSGSIDGWPLGYEAVVSMKVCDSGSYFLLDNVGEIVGSIEQDYVPNHLVPGEYGDYVNLDIGKDGFVKNWPKRPSLEDFFPDD